MQINISTRHGHLSSATQEKIIAKVSKLERFHDRLSAADVIIDLGHKETPRVELCVSVEKSEDLVATDEADNLHAALDTCIRKVEHQLRKHKEKTIEHRGTGRRTEVETDDLVVEE